MRLTIQFGRTTSARLQEAIRKAQNLPGFTQRDGERGQAISVAMDVPFANPTLWKEIDDLLRIVERWKSTTISLDGKPVPAYSQATWELAEIISCYAAKQSARSGADYCLGIETPTSDITSFGCRFLKGVYLRDFGRSGARWYEFGYLSDDHKRFTTDKKAVEARLRDENRSRLCVSCPAFSWKRVSEAIDSLPGEIDLEKSDKFSLKFSELDPTRPVGIRSKARHLGLSVPLGLTEGPPRDLAGDAPPRRVPTVFYKDVAGQDEALQQLRDVCELPLKHADYFRSLGLAPHRGVILFGPPGNGKTLLAKAVATESNAHFELINGPEILSKWVGQTEGNLRRVFDRARTLAPSIIVIDELDAIAPARALMMQQHEITLISQLLVCLDGMQDRGSVFVIGTTNRLEAVDPALKRPGRFDYHIQVLVPSAVGRQAILQLHLSKLARTHELDVADIVASTPNWSGAELQALVTEAGLLAIKRSIRSEIAPSATTITQYELSAAVSALSAKREARHR
jgi:AAA+ superfamily predicted ATPase